MASSGNCTRIGAPHNKPSGARHLLHLGHGGHPPPDQAHHDGDDHRQGQDPLPHTDEPLRLAGITPFQLARGQPRRTEQFRQTLFHIFAAGIGICERWRNSAWGWGLACLRAMGYLLSLGSLPWYRK